MPSGPRSGALVGIDVGTTTCKVVAFGPDGKRLAADEAPTPRASTTEGPASLEPEAVWRQVERLLRSVVEQRRVDGIGVCAQLATVFVDESGRPTHPAMPWSDPSAAGEAVKLQGELGSAAPARVGRPITAESTAARLRWLAQQKPAAFRRTRHVMMLKDYIVFRLCGELITDAASASFSQLFDVATRAWALDLAAASGIDESILPPVRDGSAMAGVVTDKRPAGLPAGTPVAAGGPDGSVGALGAGAFVARRGVDIAGSTDVLYAIADKPAAVSGGVVTNAFVVAGRWSFGGPTGLTGGAMSWLAELLGYPTARALHDKLDVAAARVPAGSEGLAFRTALTGERFPHWDDSRSGALVGLRPSHRATHLVRAADEGAAFLVLDGLEALAQAGFRLDEVVVVGGIASRPYALQLRADVWSRPVITTAEREASALGAAMLAGMACGRFSSAEEATHRLVRDQARFEARTDPGTALAAARDHWREAAT